MVMKTKNIIEWIELLEAIDYTGSINKASKEIGITYKTAWKRLHKLKEIYYNESIVQSEIGGNQRGGTYLTTFGRELLKKLKKK